LAHESETGRLTGLTYQELAAEVARLCGALIKMGAGPGDRIGLFLPDGPPAAVSLLACAKIGAVAVPLSAGYGSDAIAMRLNDSGATFLICADGCLQRGSVLAMKEVVDRALTNCPQVKNVIMHRTLMREVPWKHGRDLVWEQLLEDQPESASTHMVNSESPLILIYPAGHDGPPRGAIHTHSGLPVKAALDLAHGFDVGADDHVMWVSEFGWATDPGLIYGALLLGATLVLFEGPANHPRPDRLWRMVADYEVTILGVTADVIGPVMRGGPELPANHDLSKLRVLVGSNGTWDLEAFHWLFEKVGGGRIPIINYRAARAGSGAVVCGNVLAPMRQSSFAGPGPGVAADVVDNNGNSVRGQLGELVIRQPWVGMPQGIWNDSDGYWGTFGSGTRELWVEGAQAYVDPNDGLWYTLDRPPSSITTR
jgi:acetyl-CoA synthetase